MSGIAKEKAPAGGIIGGIIVCPLASIAEMAVRHGAREW